MSETLRRVEESPEEAIRVRRKFSEGETELKTKSSQLPPDARAFLLREFISFGFERLSEFPEIAEEVKERKKHREVIKKVFPNYEEHPLTGLAKILDSGEVPEEYVLEKAREIEGLIKSLSEEERELDRDELIIEKVFGLRRGENEERITAEREDGSEIVETFRYSIDQRYFFEPGTKIDIVLRTKEGVEFSFNDLLPESCSFAREFHAKNDLKCWSAGYSPRENEIHVCYGNLDDDFSLLKLLHEIGHARYMRETKDFGYHDEIPKDRARIERAAWSRALKMLKELERDGINIFPKEVGNQELFAAAKEALLSHKAFMEGKFGKDEKFDHFLNREIEK